MGVKTNVVKGPRVFSSRVDKFDYQMFPDGMSTASQFGARDHLDLQI